MLFLPFYIDYLEISIQELKSTVIYQLCDCPEERFLISSK